MFLLAICVHIFHERILKLTRNSCIYIFSHPLKYLKIFIVGESLVTYHENSVTINTEVFKLPTLKCKMIPMFNVNSRNLFCAEYENENGELFLNHARTHTF